MLSLLLLELPFRVEHMVGIVGTFLWGYRRIPRYFSTCSVPTLPRCASYCRTQATYLILFPCG